MKLSFTYQYRLLLRVILTLSTGFVCFFVFLETDFWLLGILLALLTAILAFVLYRFLLTAERELDNFLMAVKQNDFTTGFASTRFILGEKIPGAFKLISEEFQKIRSEKETEHSLLTTIVEHLTVPVLCYQIDSGKVSIYNKAAQKLLKKPFIRSIHTLQKVNKTLYEAVTRIKPGERDLVKITVSGEMHHLAVHATEVVMRGDACKLISLQDIKNELDEQEIISWQRLIRVLTHEIKNSAIPIATMSEVLQQIITDNADQIKFTDNAVSESIEKGINTIMKRSKNLAAFIEGYDRLTKLPKPEFERVNLNELVNSILALYDGDLSRHDITFDLKSQRTITLETDPKILEQVLINLLKNGIEACLEKEGERLLTVQITDHNVQTVIMVIDNGPGIPEAIKESIFIPFFTTKSKGSGIGLSLSRQLVRLLGGTLSVVSDGSGTRFSVII